MANQYMQEEDDAILKTYNRYPVVLDHGDGAYLYDPEGKKYLDFSAGYAVSSLGYNNKEFNDALKAQIDKMIHTSNLYYNTTCGKAGRSEKDHRYVQGILHKQWWRSNRRCDQNCKKICVHKKNRTL